MSVVDWTTSGQRAWLTAWRHWTRPIAPHCHQCGSTEVVAFGVPLIERSRGSQMSITAMHIETLCRTCDADRLAAPHQGHLPPSLGD